MPKTRRKVKTSTRGSLADIRKALDGDMAAGLIDVSEAITDHPVIPTGVRAIDELIGIGGWPRGSACEVFGKESSGKSTLAIQTCAAVQRAGGVAAYLDFEQSTTPDYLQSLGVDTNGDRFLYAQPECVEDAFEIINALLETAAADVIVWDSVAVSACRKELEDDYDGIGISPKPKVLAARMRKLAQKLGPNGLFPDQSVAPVILFLNHAQVALNTIARWGQEILRTPGGDFLKYLAKVRLMTAIRGTVKGRVKNPLTNKNEDMAIARRLRVLLVKSKVSPPLRVAEVLIRFGLGISNTDTLIEVAIAKKVLHRSRSGKVTWAATEQEWRSVNQFEEALRDDEELWGSLAEAIGWAESSAGKVNVASEHESEQAVE